MRAQLCKNCIHEKDRCMCPPNRECSAYVPKAKKESDVRKAYKQLINYHGTDETLTICMEECAELIKEISKVQARHKSRGTDRVPRRVGGGDGGRPDLPGHADADL